MLVVVPRTGHVVTVGLGDVVLEFDQGGGSPKMDGTARPGRGHLRVPGLLRARPTPGPGQLPRRPAPGQGPDASLETGDFSGGSVSALAGGTAGGNMVQQLREDLRGLNQQLENLEAGLDQQRDRLRLRGLRLQQLIGGSRVEKKGLERLATSMKSLEASRRAFEEARKAMANLQL